VHAAWANPILSAEHRAHRVGDIRLAGGRDVASLSECSGGLAQRHALLVQILRQRHDRPLRQTPG
jgi:hypothetical protein